MNFDDKEKSWKELTEKLKTSFKTFNKIPNYPLVDDIELILKSNKVQVIWQLILWS